MHIMDEAKPKEWGELATYLSTIIDNNRDKDTNAVPSPPSLSGPSPRRSGKLSGSGKRRRRNEHGNLGPPAKNSLLFHLRWKKSRIEVVYRGEMTRLPSGNPN